jgi:hypothetical protein
MKTFTLRQLLREPNRIKRFTRAGQPVRITEDGKPLWIIQPATPLAAEAKRRLAIDEWLDQMLAEPVSSLSLSQIVKNSRR